MDIRGLAKWLPAPPKVDHLRRTIAVMAACEECGFAVHDTTDCCPICGSTMVNPGESVDLAYMWRDTLPLLKMNDYTVLPTFDDYGKLINP